MAKATGRRHDFRGKSLQGNTPNKAKRGSGEISETLTRVTDKDASLARKKLGRNDKLKTLARNKRLRT